MPAKHDYGPALVNSCVGTWPIHETLQTKKTPPAIATLHPEPRYITSDAALEPAQGLKQELWYSEPNSQG